MNALALVDKLLETDDPTDPMAYAMQTGLPVDLMRNTLRDELVERGWRHIRVEKGDDEEWFVTAGYIDEPHRMYWSNAGARVAPAPEESPDLRMKLMRLFKAAARRAGMVVTEAAFEELRPAYLDGYDLETEYEDFEQDRGDWEVVIRFRWQPGKKFWSKSSQALGYN